MKYSRRDFLKLIATGMGIAGSTAIGTGTPLKAVAKPHRTVFTREELEEERRALLREQLIQMLREDVR